MASYTYEGEQELVFPTLGLTVKTGDTFEGPEGLTIAGVVPAAAKKATLKSAPVAEDEQDA